MTDVVRTRAEADALDAPPHLVIDDLTAWFDAQGLGTGALRWRRIGDGQSNLTYLIERDDAAFVLRRGPRPPFPASAHDMVREARMQIALRSVGFPTPPIVAVCADESVLGVPFYVMARVDGLVLTDEIPAALDAPGDRRATVCAAVDTLAALHALDVTAPPLADLGRPAGYLDRQVSRFSAIWDQVSTRDLPAVHAVAQRLAASTPATQRDAVVHGDYRLGNLMFARTAPARVAAVLDWELATLGDPLADLGYLAATYSSSSSGALPIELSPITREPGYPTVDELVARYAATTGLDVSAIDWYRALALWKASIFCEAIHTRWLHGERPGDTFGPQLTAGIPAMLAEAERRLDEHGA